MAQESGIPASHYTQKPPFYDKAPAWVKLDADAGPIVHTKYFIDLPEEKRRQFMNELASIVDNHGSYDSFSDQSKQIWELANLELLSNDGKPLPWM